MDCTPRGKKGDKPQDQFDKILHNKRCPIHPKSNHTMWECPIHPKSNPKKPSQSSVKPTGDVGTKTIQLQEGDDSNTAIIGAGLGDK